MSFVKVCIIISLATFVGFAQVPDFSGLAEPDYQKRKEVHDQILEWGLKSPRESLDVIITKSEQQRDPEWKARMVSLAQEIFTSSIGYVGISMQGSMMGVGVSMVMPSTPAEKAGLKLGDVIVKVDGVGLSQLGILESTEKFAELVQGRFVGDEIELEYLRDGELQKAKLVLAAFPKTLIQEPRIFMNNGQRIQIQGQGMIRRVDYNARHQQRFKKWWDGKMAELRTKKAP